MNLDIFLIIVGILALLFAGFVLGWVLTKLVHGIIGDIIVLILFFCGAAIILLTILSFRDSITSDYRCVDTIDTYPVYNMSFEGNNTVVHYFDSNKEIKHIKSDKVKIFYDLADDREPYVIRNKYWRWFIYWEELEVHIKE